MQNITQTLLPGLQPVGSGTVILSMNGSAIGSLSPQETVLYQSLFRTALGPKAIQNSTSIPGAVAAAFLKRSGLNKKQLHDIWSLADSENQGYLVPNGFFKACRLVAHAQSSNVSLSSDLLAIEPQVLPYFESSEGSPDTVWTLTPPEIDRYAQLYRREGGLAKLDGNDARSLLTKSGLTSSELCDIWDMADVDKDGKLTFGEFLVVMQLVAKVRDGKAFLPAELPSVLSEYLKTPLPEVSAPEASSAAVTPMAGIAERSALAVETPTIGLSPSANRSATTPLGSTPTIGFGSEAVGRHHVRFGSDFAPARPESRFGLETKPEDTLQSRLLLQEQKEVSEQLGRSRQFRKQMLDGRGRLEALRSEARIVELEMVNQDHEVSRLQDQILHMKTQVGEAEEELDQFRRESGQVSLGTSGDVLIAVAAIREAIGEDEREVAELRAQLERIQREKTDLQSMHSVMLEKKRQADQDRNLLIVGLESDRSKLVTVRADRLKLWEQRHQLTREITSKAFAQIPDPLSTGRLITRDRKGVRADTEAPKSAVVSTPQLAQQWSQFGPGTSVDGAFGGSAPQFGTQ